MDPTRDSRRSLPFALLHSKLVTLSWFVCRPSLYPELARLLQRKLLRTSRGDDTSSAATQWCKSQAVDAPTALRALNPDPAEPFIGVRVRFPDRFAAAETAAAATPFRMGGAGELDLLYHAAEFLQARRVIETGVAYGWSSLALLLSLSRREGSVLVSTDLPQIKRGSKSYTGVVVPPDLRDQWRLISKADREAIPEALQLLGTIDLCHYDSDKSPGGRAWAYPLLWGALRPGGIFISDDVGDNDYFRQFAELVCVAPVVIEARARTGAKYVGVLRKPAPAN